MSTTKRTVVQRTLLALRERLGMTQQQFAVALGKSVVTVCRWETVRSPTGLSLVELGIFAHEKGAFEEAKILQDAFFVQKKGAFEKILRTSMFASETAEQALRNLYAYSELPGIRHEYWKAFGAVARAHKALCSALREGGAETVDLTYFEEVQCSLEWQAQHEKSNLRFEKYQRTAKGAKTQEKR